MIININRTIFFFAVFIFFMLKTIAQKQVNSIEWKIAGTLPATNATSQALGVAGPVTGVHNEVLVIAGGANFPDAMPWLGGKKKYHDNIYVLKRLKDSLVNYKSFKLPFSLAYSGTCSTPHGILSVGGENENGISNKAFFIQWNAADESITIKDLPDLPFAVTNAATVFNKNKIYVAGGERINDVSNELLVLDLNDIPSGWNHMASLPKPVSHTVMLVQANGEKDRIYLIGGRKRNPGSTSDLYSSVFQFDLKTKLWSEKKSLPYNLSAGTGLASGTSNIILFGGDAGETFNKTERLIAAINRETDIEKKKKLNEEKVLLQSNHPGFCKQVLLYDIRKDKWKEFGCIPFAAPVTTTAIQWNGEVVIPSGEIKAGIRTAQILMGKIN